MVPICEVVEQIAAQTIALSYVKANLSETNKMQHIYMSALAKAKNSEQFEKVYYAISKRWSRQLKY